MDCLCETGADLIGEESCLEIRVEKGGITLEYEPCIDGAGISERIEINFCPMCGSEL